MKPLAWMAIPLTQGLYALVDGEDYGWLNQHKWCVTKPKTGHTYYAMRVSSKKTIEMHWEILGLEKGDKQWSDHQNGNGLDNRRCNLRPCISSQNHQNQKPIRGGTSKYKGVSWHKNAGKWQAHIKYYGKSKNLGYFSSEIEAAKAYNRAAKELFGEFAWLNEVNNNGH